MFFGLLFFFLHWTSDYTSKRKKEKITFQCLLLIVSSLSKLRLDQLHGMCMPLVNKDHNYSTCIVVKLLASCPAHVKLYTGVNTWLH